MQAGAGTDRKKILLVGQLQAAFTDAGAAGASVEVKSNMPDAIEAVSKQDFQAVAVVMSSFAAGLESELNTLRQNCAAKIVLLARMHEEIAAIKLVGSGFNGVGLADDYLICPVGFDEFYKSLSGQRQLDKPKVSAVEKKLLERITQLEKLATEDELTGLKNRRYLWEFSRQIIERAKSQKDRVTLFVFDIDDFKHYNDVYGHPAGDEILKQAAVLMRRCCREYDVVGRIGGDEFAVVFWDEPAKKADRSAERRAPAAEHPREVVFIAKRFLREMGNAELPMLGVEGKGVLSISGGLASYPRDGETTEELFARADEALLEAKRSGKNRIYLVGAAKNGINKIQ